MIDSIPNNALIFALIACKIIEIKDLDVLKYLIALAPVVQHLIHVFSLTSLRPIPTQKSLVLTLMDFFQSVRLRDLIGEF